MIKFEILNATALTLKSIEFDSDFSVQIEGLPRYVIDEFVNMGFDCRIKSPEIEPDVAVGHFKNYPYGLEIQEGPDGEPSDIYMAWADAVMSAAASYKELISLGATELQARQVLPLNNNQILIVRTRVSRIKWRDSPTKSALYQKVLSELMDHIKAKTSPTLFD